MNDLQQDLTEMWDRFFDWLPQLIGALVVLIVVYMIAKILQSAVRKALGAINFDQHVHGSSGGQFLQRAFPAPSRLAGSIVYWLVFLFGLGIALSILGIPMLNDILQGVYDYIPKVIAAVLIFLAAGAISSAASAFIMRVLGDTPTGKIAGAAVPVVVMGIAAFMILEQLSIAPTIVTITYAALIGSMFLGLALAFGLGGRGVAASILENAYQASRENRTQVQRDLKVAKERTKSDSKRLKNKLK